MFIDTHCHLDSARFDGDLNAVLANAKNLGVEKIVIPGADIADLPKAIKIAEQNAGVFFAAGVHPYEVGGFDLAALESAIKHPKCVAVGECGLDYYRLPEGGKSVVDAYKARQKEVFEAQIELALKHDLPLIVHIREASSDSLEILKAHKNLRGILHCFNADAQLLALSTRFYYGIGGVATFKNARKLVEVLPKIPIEKIVLETDAPYLAPEPHRGQRNSPEFIPTIAQKVAEILGIDAAKLKEISTQNAKKIFAKMAA